MTQFPLYVEGDQVYNLACPHPLLHYTFRPVQTCQTSSWVRVNIWGLGEATKSRILGIDSFEVYGDPTFHPQP